MTNFQFDIERLLSYLTYRTLKISYLQRQARLNDSYLSWSWFPKPGGMNLKLTLPNNTGGLGAYVRAYLSLAHLFSLETSDQLVFPRE